MDKRVVFTFDEQSFAALYELTEGGDFDSMAECMRESMQIAHLFEQLALQGFTPVITRNPRTGAEQELVVPHVERIRRWRCRR